MHIRTLLQFTALVLLLGIATTVGVAWAFAGVDPRAVSWDEYWDDSWGNGWNVRESGGPVHWSGFLFTGEFPMLQAAEDGTLQAPRWSMAHRPPQDGVEVALEEARGWPFLSLRCAFVQGDNPYRDPADIVVGGVAIRPIVGRSPPSPFSLSPPEAWNAIPLTPIWGGLLGSTLFYAVAWVLAISLLTAPAAVMRRRRARKGQCIRCGYARADPSRGRCSECGWEADRRFPLLSPGRMAAGKILACAAVAAAACWLAVLTLTYQGVAPIHLAAAANDVATLKHLIAEGADVSAQLDGRDIPDFLSGSTPLHWAARWQSTDALRALASAGADIDSKGGTLFTPLVEAAWFGNAEAVVTLIDLGAEIDRTEPRRPTALSAAVLRSQLDIVRLLIEQGADPNAGPPDTMPPMLTATGSRGTLEMVRLLIDAGSDVDATQENGWESAPLARAAGAGRIDLMEALVEAGAGIEPPVELSPLASALGSGKVEAAAWLMERGATLSKEVASTTLPSACQLGFIDAARVLLTLGADPDQPDDYGRLPLRHAIDSGSYDVVQVLLDGGADPNLLIGDSPPLHVAVRTGDVRLVRMLLEAGVDPSVKEAGRSAIEVSADYASQGRAAAVEISRLLREAARTTRMP